ncbi:BIG/ATPase V1 complex, subunit S1 [Xylariales sp. AK1849]|nr:BIG/ATPase V1 complex, subunit S1 [Xylariales sp. AK1849]
MRLSIVVLAAGCATAYGFSNTSPFLMFSTSKFASSPDELRSSEAVHSVTTDILSSCPTERYLLVSQPNLNIQHLASSTAAPKLQNALTSSAIQGRLSISEMSGTVDLNSVSSFLRESCQSTGKTPSIDVLALDPLPASGQFQDLVESLRENDDNLGVVLQQYEMAGDYTFIYTAGPRTEEAKEAKSYEATFRDTTHQELKRQLGKIQRREDARDTRPLFEKYQFFTPGIFMGLVALFILFSILGVGISALGSLQVPYGAFDKEMGPAAQKKQN